MTSAPSVGSSSWTASGSSKNCFSPAAPMAWSASMQRKVTMSDAPLIYLAAPWKDRELARRVRQQFLDAGIRVNSRWLDFEGDEALAPDVVKRQEALNDKIGRAH